MPASIHLAMTSISIGAEFVHRVRQQMQHADAQDQPTDDTHHHLESHMRQLDVTGQPATEQ